MKILIIGGSGFIGPFVANQLKELDHDVILFNRGKSQNPLALNFERILGERKNLISFKDEFKKYSPDVVIDMIPLGEEDAIKTLETFKGITDRIIAISSQDVYSAYGKLNGLEEGEPEAIPLKETANLRSKLYPYRNQFEIFEDHYLWNYDKILVEKVYMSDPDISGTILRLPMVYGPFDKQHRLYDIIKRIDDKRTYIILMKGFDKWRWTRSYVENVANAIVLAATNNASKNQIYNVGEPQTLSMNEWVELIGNVSEWNGELVVIPREHIPENLKIDINIAHNLVIDSTKIRKDLRFKEIISLNESIQRTIEWERANPPSKIDISNFNYSAEDEALNFKS
jgi:nucleoside-diphosphate-sugar epimerase